MKHKKKNKKQSLPAERSMQEIFAEEPSAEELSAEIPSVEEPSAEATEGVAEAVAASEATQEASAEGAADVAEETVTAAVTATAESPEETAPPQEPAETVAKAGEEAPRDTSEEVAEAIAERPDAEEADASEEPPTPEELSEETCPPAKNKTKKKKRARRHLTPVACDSAALHRPRDTVGTLRTDFLVALLPLLGWSVYLYGLRPLTLTLIAVLSSCLLDMGCQAILRHRFFLDTDAVVIGALIALGLPPTAPLWLPCAAAAIAVLPVRLILKGRLRRFVNPAALALLVLTLALPAVMGCFAATGERLSPFAMTAEGFTEAGESILDVTLNGGLPETETLASTFFGLRHGRIGESSVLLLLAAALYLGFRKQLRIWFPAFFLLAAGVLLYLFPRTAVASDMIALRFVGYQLMGTEMLFGALFLASDSFTAPRSPRVAILCGLLGGALTVGLRYYVEPQAAVLGAVLAVGLLATPLEILLRPAVFGGRRKKKKSSPPTHTPEAVA